MWNRFIDLLRVAGIPVAIAAAGYFIQQALQENQLRTDRLNLSVGILADPASTQPLRTLAVKLLDHSLPNEVPLDEQLRLSLETGATNFPPEYKGWGVIRAAVGTAGIKINGSAVGETIQAIPDERVE